MSTNGLKITDIIIFPAKDRAPKSNLLGFAKFVLNEHFLVSGVRIMQGRTAPFLSYPKEAPVEGGRAWDICSPITAEFREYASEMVLGRYDMLVKAGQA